MDGLETRGVYDATWEIRQEGQRPIIRATFPYNSYATIASTGRVRKETVRPRAFRFAIEDETREINFLLGHDFGKPLASKRNRTLEFEDGPDALRFEAAMPPAGEQPSWVTDFLTAYRTGLITGISPGFNVPPASVVPGATDTEPEEGDPGVFVRVLQDVLLLEMSAVTRAAYPDTFIEERASGLAVPSHNLELLRWL